MSSRDARLLALLKPYQAVGPRGYYLAFFDCFNRQLFFEAHEVLEELWRAQPGPNRAFYQGLIQFAGAFVHLQKNRLRPALALLRLACANLQPYPAWHEGLDLKQTLSLIRTWESAILNTGFTQNPYSPQNPPHLPSPGCSPDATLEASRGCSESD